MGGRAGEGLGVAEEWLGGRLGGWGEARAKEEPQEVLIYPSALSQPVPPYPLPPPPTPPGGGPPPFLGLLQPAPPTPPFPLLSPPIPNPLPQPNPTPRLRALFNVPEPPKQPPPTPLAPTPAHPTPQVGGPHSSLGPLSMSCPLPPTPSPPHPLPHPPRWRASFTSQTARSPWCNGMLRSNRCAPESMTSWTHSLSTQSRQHARHPALWL